MTTAAPADTAWKTKVDGVGHVETAPQALVIEAHAEDDVCTSTSMKTTWAEIRQHSTKGPPQRVDFTRATTIFRFSMSS